MEIDTARDNRPFDKDAILEKVSKFLDTYSEGDGGWSPVSTEDFIEARELMDEILRYKFRPDPDGDGTVQFKLIDRNKGYDPCPFVIQYPHKITTDEERFYTISRCNSVIKNMSDTIDYLTWSYNK